MTMQPLTADDPALSEITKQYVHDTRANPLLRTIMDNPCCHVDDDGTVCGQSWKVDNDTIRAIHNVPARGTHSFRGVPLEIPSEPAGGIYRLAKDDMERFGIEAPRPLTAAEMYLSEKQAAAMLKVNVKALREMVKAKTIEVDKIADVTLVRRQSVERVIALAEELASAEGDDDE